MVNGDVCLENSLGCGCMGRLFRVLEYGFGCGNCLGVSIVEGCR